MSLSDAQVDLNPHQVEAALFAFRSPLSKGAILADEVGLGKTIEAGILLSQKWAERKRKLLIIVPSNLRKQWNQELLDKFFLPTKILESASFNQEITKGNLNPFNQNDIVICSYHFARAKDVYIQQINWDLVIIDEAHRLRNVYKPTNKIGNAIRQALVNIPKVLLTATPLQNSLMELYGLVSIIDDYTFGDVKSFRSQFAKLGSDDNFDDLKERLKPICKRTLRRQVMEYIPFTNRLAIVEEFVPTEEEQRLYELVSDYLQRPNLYALPPSQRQLMTLILRKLLASSTYAISGTLEALAGKLEGVVQNQENPVAIEEVIAEDFEALGEIKEEWTDEEEQAALFRYTPEELRQIKEEIGCLKEFNALAKSITKNSKGEVLLTALKRGFAEAGNKGGQKKALIFTESVRTQTYLRNILEQTEYAGRIVLFNGSNNDPKSREIYKHWLEKHQGTDRVTGSRSADMRAALVDYFRDEAVIMIATEAGAEGMNLQFCSLVVNYDLPWNPQRIEQRIGRCHRYGQKYDVVVVNFLNKNNAADQRVYQLLSEKFKLFDGVFGASDEVLGSIESGVEFEKRIAQIYQTCRTLEEIQTSFDALQRELEGQIDETLNVTRRALLENFDEEVHEKLRVNLQESKEYLSKYESWLWQITKFCLEPYARFDHTENSFLLVENPFPNEKIHPGPYRIGKNIDDANTYRIGHPLAQRIIEQCKTAQLQEKELVFDYSGSRKKISALEPLIGQFGWLIVTNLTITAFETEDYVVLNGAADDGAMLDDEQCRRMFSLPAIQKELDSTDGFDSVKQSFKDNLTHTQNRILERISSKNASYFELELDKLDKWGDDRRNSLKVALKELEDGIKELKKQSRLAPNLPEKLKLEKERRQLETKRDEAWKEYDNAAKEIERKKDELIDVIEKKLRQQLTAQQLFAIRWSVV
jgi:ERCC4-related helicase